MTSPSKRPAVTYQRSSRPKILASSASSGVPVKSLINPDAALQQKINDLIFSKEGKGIKYEIEEEEFDSAYHETAVTKKLVVFFFLSYFIGKC